MLSIISFVKNIFVKSRSPPIRYPLNARIAPERYANLVRQLTVVPISEQIAQTNVSQGTSLKETPNMNFILYMNAVSSIIQAVEAAAQAYTTQSGQAVPGADKMKSVVALVGSAGSAFAAFLPGLESLVGTLVQSYNDSGLFKKKAA